MPQAKQYWLMKTEPESFSIQDLAKCPRKTTFWDGVRNYQARNFMRAMKTGDEVLFYHSSADPPAVVGTASVVGEAYPDYTAWDPDNHHFDPKASPTNPIWDMVDIRLGEIFSQPLGLNALRDVPALAKMELLRRGSRLSVQPVTKVEFETVVRMGRSAKTAKVATVSKPKKTAKPAKAGKRSP
jgi:predicted RNA-binding protein with PUA-like domain